MAERLSADFFSRDCLEVAPDLVGKIVVHRLADGTEHRVRILETEAYRGEEDLACHASKGRTKRTELLYGKSGVLYIYLCYGMHWLMNVVTGRDGEPQGVLLRAGEDCVGPARLTKRLGIDGTLHGTALSDCTEELWFEDDGQRFEIRTAPRVGVDYAGEYWAGRPWRFILSK